MRQHRVVRDRKPGVACWTACWHLPGCRSAQPHRAAAQPPSRFSPLPARLTSCRVRQRKGSLVSTSCTRLRPREVTKKREPLEKASGIMTQEEDSGEMKWAGCGGQRGGRGGDVRCAVEDRETAVQAQREEQGTSARPGRPTLTLAHPAAAGVRGVDGVEHALAVACRHRGGAPVASGQPLVQLVCSHAARQSFPCCAGPWAPTRDRDSRGAHKLHGHEAQGVLGGCGQLAHGAEVGQLPHAAREGRGGDAVAGVMGQGEVQQVDGCSEKQVGLRGSPLKACLCAWCVWPGVSCAHTGPLHSSAAHRRVWRYRVGPVPRKRGGTLRPVSVLFRSR
jgi:hypothetical protein